MPANLICEGGLVRAPGQKSLWFAVPGLLFLALALSCLVFAAMLVVDVFGAHENGNGVFVAIPLLLLASAVTSALAVVILGRRAIIADKASDRVVREFRLGPFRWLRAHTLSDFNKVTLIWNQTSVSDSGGKPTGVFEVNLTGDDDVEALRVDSFSRFRPAIEFARAFAGAIGLPFEDLSDTDADDPDLRDVDDEEEPAEAVAKTAPAPSKRNASSNARVGKKPVRLVGLSREKGLLVVELPMSTWVSIGGYPIILALLGLNCCVWWFDWQLLRAMFTAANWRWAVNIVSAIADTGVSPIDGLAALKALAWLALAPAAAIAVTVIAGLPLLAGAGFRETFVFDPDRREAAFVRKSVLLNQRRSTPIGSLAKLTVEKPPAPKRGATITVYFVAEPGSRPRLLQTFSVEEHARRFADAIAEPMRLPVEDV